MRIRAVLLIGAFGALVILVALIGGRESRPALSLDTYLAENSLMISGQTDLPDGTLVDYEFWAVDPNGQPALGLDLRAEAVVKSGRYQASHDLSSWPKVGILRVWVAFAPDSRQPIAVQERYGIGGTRLSGRDVVEDSEGKRVILMRDIPRTEAVNGPL